MNKRFLVIIFIVAFIIFSGCTSKLSEQQNNSQGDVVSGGSEFSLFDYPPIDPEKIGYIIPMGNMDGSHVTPVDHQYYIPYDRNSMDTAVYSPGNGVVISIGHMNVSVGDKASALDDYRIVIKHSDKISSVYIHIDFLSEKLAAFDPGLGNNANTNIEVASGEVIGRGNGIDYNIVDENVTLSFVNPSSYAVESWKIHCSDPFDYFNESVRNVMVSKCLRSAKPVGGKIDYDIDGRLVGTWFLNNTNGYEGLDKNRYWAGHLVIAYNNIDPDEIIVSIGTYINSSMQFAVKGNSPNPANVSVSELVKYELVNFDYYANGIKWDRASFARGLEIINNDEVQGVILLQLVDNRTLNVEIFPGKSADEVSGFKENASTYVR